MWKVFDLGLKNATADLQDETGHKKGDGICKKIDTKKHG